MTTSVRHLPMSPPRQAQGFSLLEVMVALVIVSVAALGLGGLQTVTLRNNTNALLESQAATLIQDLIERMRANPGGVYAAGFGAAVPSGGVVNGMQCEGVGANCSAAQMALYDLTVWKCMLGATVMSALCTARNIPAQLPNGDGSVVAAGGVVTISIQWFDATTNANRTLFVDSVL